MRTLYRRRGRVGAVLPELTIELTPDADRLHRAGDHGLHPGPPRRRSGARAQGSKDIFLNILTTMGLVERYVTDWAGSGGADPRASTSGSASPRTRATR